MVLTDCAARRCSAGHALAGVASNYDVITSPAHDRPRRQTCLGGGMHSASASSLCLLFCFVVRGLTVVVINDDDADDIPVHAGSFFWTGLMTKSATR